MSRPKKTVTPENGTPAPKRIKRPDALPFKVYFKHFAANLSLGCIRSTDGVQKVYLYDTATRNYSDVTELAEIAAVAKKIFRGKDAQMFILAAFFNPTHAEKFMDSWLEDVSTIDKTPAPAPVETPEPEIA